MRLIRLLEIGLLWGGLWVVVPRAFNFLVAQIDRLVPQRYRRPVGRRRPPALDPYIEERDRAFSTFPLIDPMRMPPRPPEPPKQAAPIDDGPWPQ